MVNYLNENDKLGLHNVASYGFIAGSGGVKAAVQKAKNLRNQYPWAFKSDITSFFDQIKRDQLKDDLLKSSVKNSSITPLLFDAIDCEVDASNDRKRNQVAAAGIIAGIGLRQGMPLSPMLSNFVLKDFDRALAGSNGKLIRYADDFIILTKTKEDCEKFYPLVQEILSRKGHAIPPLEAGSKTIICDPSTSVEFLGLEIAQKSSGNRYDAVVPKKAFEGIKKELETTSSLEIALKDQKVFAQVISEINSMISGYISVYRWADNFIELQSHIANCRAAAFTKLLKSIFGDTAVSNLTEAQKKFLGISDLLSPEIPKR